MELSVYDYDSYDKDNAAQNVEDSIAPLLKGIDGIWLYKEPEYRTDGNDLPTFTILSQETGLIFIKVFDYQEQQIDKIDDKYWQINGEKKVSKFKVFQNYVHKIKSRIEDPLNDFDDDIEIHIFYVFPYMLKPDLIDGYKPRKTEHIVLGNKMEFSFPNSSLSDNDYCLLVSIIQNANIINKSTSSFVDEPAKNMREAIVLNEQKISQFDREQLRASWTITEKSERIRGLAGSGKTVLLAMKAARLHYKYPNKKIAFVFYTKSLYNQATSLIRKYFNLIAENEPNWDNLKVLHSWGGATTGEGFYSYICKEIGMMPLRYSPATSFRDVCNDLLSNKNLYGIFDYVLVDEAQDFPLEFFLLVEKVLKEPKKVVIAYDELQTTNDISIPDFTTLFGVSEGKPNIELDPQHDYLLRKSYRNTLEVLVTAFSFGFGFYGNLTQIIQDYVTWNALGFDVDGELKEGNEITVTRPRENSPNSVLSFFVSEKPVQDYIFSNISETISAVIDKIEYLIKEQNILPEDILVIDIKMNKEKTLSAIQAGLYAKEINSHIPGVVTDARDFFKTGHVTLSTPRNAKGNEVPVVLLIGCENIYEKKNITEQRQARNFMFISMTRSKGWVYLYATGRVKTKFQDEIKRINRNIPSIHFTYPSSEVVNQITKINYLIDNPAAKQIDYDIEKFKAALKNADRETLKALIELDPDFKLQLKGILGE